MLAKLGAEFGLRFELQILADEWPGLRFELPPPRSEWYDTNRQNVGATFEAEFQNVWERGSR